ncbi:MAG: MFS transporter, partial [Chitinophagaceae bacterium]|nr:MFS transporter [Chitinophagaceae bacterium]
MPKLIKNEGLSPLKEAEFRRYISVRFLFIMSLRMVSTVVAYKLFQLTQSSFAIGLIGLSEFIPVFSLALYAGHIIDKSDKKTILLRGMMAYTVCAIALVMLTAQYFNQHLSITSQEYCFYAIIFVTGIIRAFVGPTSNAIVAQLVPRNILQFAANISSSTWLIASIVGHASAGFLIAGIGIHN